MHYDRALEKTKSKQNWSGYNNFGVSPLGATRQKERENFTPYVFTFSLDWNSPEVDCRRAGPCRTEFSDVGFDFIVVGTNKI